jgi:putative SOS response-associated peptidase YedK
VWRAPDGTWLRTCTIVTVPANSLVAPIHDRMPAILPPGRGTAWLTAPPDEARALLVPLPAEEMEALPVSPRVNSPAVDDPACIEPLARPLALPLEG